MEFTSLNCRGIWAGIKINFQIEDLDRVSIKIFRTGRWIGIIANFSEERNVLGGMSIIMVGDMIKEPSTEGGVRQGRKRFMVRGV